MNYQNATALIEHTEVSQHSASIYTQLIVVFHVVVCLYRRG
jgi:hypothetical protein